jgi:hypothetical protein
MAEIYPEIPPDTDKFVFPEDRIPGGTKYPPIDMDPHFKRVVSYMRPTDFGLWAFVTGLAPALLSGISEWQRVESQDDEVQTCVR